MKDTNNQEEKGMRKKGLAMLMAGIMIVSSCVMGCAKDDSNDIPAKTSAAASETEAQSEKAGTDTTQKVSGEIKGDINGDGIFKVGFSELAIDGAWRVAQVDSMQKDRVI